jgi:hypothetical protein
MDMQPTTMSAVIATVTGVVQMLYTTSGRVSLFDAECLSHLSNLLLLLHTLSKTKI